MLIKSGFTLFEILIVISTIIFLISISINFFKLNNETLVLIELEKLYSCLLYLQNKAKIELKNQYLILNIKDNSYKYNNYPDKIQLSKHVIFGFLENSKGPPSNAKYLINKASTFKNNTIIFYKDGTISSGVIYIKDKNNQFMYALSSGISSITYLRRYKYIQNSNQNNWHLLH